MTDSAREGKSRHLPRYPAYRRTSVEWLGEVPEDWPLRRLKHALVASIGGGTPETNRDDYWSEADE